MSEYTSTREGYQRAMQWAYDGPDAKAYAAATTTTSFYHLVNGVHTALDDYIKNIEECQKKVSDYHPVVDHFLRDGDQLAAHMTGTIKVDGNLCKFECFMFAKINQESGKMEWLEERSIWGPADGSMDKGLGLVEKRS